MFAPSNIVPIILETHEAPILKVGIHLRKLGLTYFAFFHTCESVLKSWNTFPSLLFLSYFNLGCEPKPRLQQKMFWWVVTILNPFCCGSSCLSIDQCTWIYFSTKPKHSNIK
jgi:hypothetical protein